MGMWSWDASPSLFGRGELLCAHRDSCGTHLGAISAALTPATCRVAAATSPAGPARQRPSLVLVQWPSDCSLSLAPRDAFLAAELLLSAAGCQCMLRQKVVFPEMESWVVHQSVMLAGGEVTTDSAIASNELACAFSSRKPRQVPRWLGTKRSSWFSHRSTCQSVSQTSDRDAMLQPLHSSPWWFK